MVERQQPEPGLGNGAQLKKPARGRNLQGAVFSVALPLIPILAGLVAGIKWPSGSGDFYSLMAQVIATLFVAICVEFFLRDTSIWTSRNDKFTVVALIAITWTGLFGCIRAMLVGGDGYMTGLATAGIVAASVLVSLALFARVQGSSRAQPALMLVLLLPAVLLLYF